MQTMSPARQSEETESFNFCCPACSKLLSLERQFAGMDGPCPKCGRDIVSADPWRGRQAKIAGMPDAPVKRTIWTPETGKATLTESPVRRNSPPPLAKKIGSIADLPKHEVRPNKETKEMRKRLKQAMSRRERMSLAFSSMRKTVQDPNTLSWIRTIISLLAIGAVVAGIILVRAKG